MGFQAEEKHLEKALTSFLKACCKSVDAERAEELLSEMESMHRNFCYFDEMWRKRRPLATPMAAVILCVLVNLCPDCPSVELTCIRNR